MKTYNEITLAIEELPSTVNPHKIIMFNTKRSDGLTQTNQHHIYSEKIDYIRKSIWRQKFTLSEKLELNEYLVKKLAK